MRQALSYGSLPVDGSDSTESTCLQNEGQLRRPAFYFVAIAVGRLNAWVEARGAKRKAYVGSLVASHSFSQSLNRQGTAPVIP